MRGKKTLAAGLTLLFLLLAGCGSGNNGKDSGAAAGNTASSADISSGWDIGFGGEAAPMEPSADEQGTDSSVYQNAGAKLVRRAEQEITADSLEQLPAFSRQKVLSVEEMERERIGELLRQRYSKEEIARLLGISRATLYRKIKQYQFL